MMKKRLIALLTAIVVITVSFIGVQAETELPLEYTFDDYTDKTGDTLPSGVTATNTDASVGAYICAKTLSGRKSMEIVNLKSQKNISARFASSLNDEIKTIETAFCREYIDGSDATLELYYGGKLPQLINFTKTGDITSMGVATGYKYEKNVWYDIKVTVNFTTKRMEIVLNGGDYNNLRIDTKLNYTGIDTDTAKPGYVIVGNRNLTKEVRSNLLVDYLKITTANVSSGEINIRENFENYAENTSFTSKIGNMTYVGYSNTNSMNIVSVNDDMGKSLSLNKTAVSGMMQIRQVFSSAPQKFSGSFAMNFASGDARRGVLLQVYKNDNSTVILYPFIFAVNGKIYTNENIDSSETWNLDTWYNCSFEIDFENHKMICNLEEMDNPDGIKITSEHSINENIARPYTCAAFMGGDSSAAEANSTTYLDNLIYSGDQNLRYCFIKDCADEVSLKESVTLVFNKNIDEGSLGNVSITVGDGEGTDASCEVAEGNLLKIIPGEGGFLPESTYCIDISALTDKDGNVPETGKVTFNTMANVVSESPEMTYEIDGTEINATITKNIYFSDKENRKVKAVFGLYDVNTNKLIKSFVKEYEGYDINVSLPLSTQIDKVAGQKLVAHFWDSFGAPQPYFDITQWKGADYIE